MNAPCTVDLSKSDEYENGVIPDRDVEICLKVIRSIRNQLLWPNFDAEGAVVLSHAHAKIVDLVKQTQEEEKAQNA